MAGLDCWMIAERDDGSEYNKRIALCERIQSWEVSIHFENVTRFKHQAQRLSSKWRKGEACASEREIYGFMIFVR